MKITFTRVSLLLAVLLAGLVTPVAAQETKLKWFGHAAFSITTPKGKVLLVDPWLSNPSNPEAKDGKNALAALAKVDYILEIRRASLSRSKTGRRFTTRAIPHISETWKRSAKVIRSM
jgi:hypothetical protein